MPSLRRARLDPSLRAVLHELAPLRYARGEDAAGDHLGHVRAASAVRRWQGRMVLVQDDVNVLALRDDAGGVEPRLLPWGEGRRRTFGDELGNKHAKLDLEAGLVLPDGRFVALGSGSSPRRERVVVAWPDGRVALREGAELYAALRADVGFCGAELNVEGATVVGERLWLVQRGNGAATDSAQPVDATAELDLAAWVAWLDGRAGFPPLERVTAYDLGTIDGVRLGFTDAAALPDGRVAFVAAAEASPDAVRDGEVVGCRFGVIASDEVITCDVTGPSGERSRLKLEGLEHAGVEHAGVEHEGLEHAGLEPSTAGDPEGTSLRLWAAVDMDRPDHPAMLGRLHVAWR
jgi:hypothetical protein